MRNKAHLILAGFIFLISFSACEKDDSTSGTLGSALSGTFSFSSNEDVVVRKWIAGGLERTPTTLERDSILEEAKLIGEGVKFVFNHDFTLIVIDSISSEQDTGRFKLENNLVLVSGNNNPVNDDYFPLFTYSNNRLQHNLSFFQFKSNNGSISGLSMLHFHPVSILDSGLESINYQNINQLKTGEEIFTAQFKVNYSKR